MQVDCSRNARAGSRGSLLVFTLIVVTLSLLMAGALLLVGRQAGSVGYEGHRAIQKQALAKACINRLIQHLQLDQAFQGDLNWSSASGQESYRLTFDDSQNHYSTNNLNGGSTQVSSLDGQLVPRGNLEAIVVAQSGISQSTYRFVLGKGYGTLASFGANGAIRFGQDVTLRSITSLSDPAPAAFAIVSNSTTDGISYVSPGTFSVGNEVEMRSAGPIDSLIQAAFPNPDSWQESAPQQALPQVGLRTLVDNQSGLTPPTVDPTGTVRVHGDHYSSGSMVVNGSVDLSDGALYVSGDLTVNGAINGFGSVFATGDVTIRGGSALVTTNSRSGAAVYAGGDLTFTGLDASAYLDSLANSASGVSAGLDVAWSNFQAGYDEAARISQLSPHTYTTPSFPNGIDAVMGVPAATLRPTWLYDNAIGGVFDAYPHSRDLFALKMKLGPGWNNGPAVNQELIPRPGPNGHRSWWHDGSLSKQMRDRLQTLPGAGTDPRLGHLVQSFEEIAYIFRHDWRAPAVPEWDSQFSSGNFQPNEISFDQVLWLVAGYSGRQYFEGQWNANPGTTPPRDFVGNYFENNQVRANENFETLFEHNPPLDYSWLGKSYFQGVLYASGDVTLENDATVIGAIMSGGDLNLTDGTEFTYNKEYEELFQNDSGPVRVLSFSKL